MIETPKWLDGKADVPGLDLIPNLRYAINSRVPVNVGGGNISEAQQSLRDLLASWDRKLTTIVYDAVLSAPVVARWYPNDRFGLAISGLTGNGKTEFLKNAMGTYGRGYLNEDNLMRWGGGATINAIMKAAATSGILPFQADNYKSIKKEDESNLIIVIQAVLEGSDRARLTSDSEFKESLRFGCTLLITGEDFPRESSTMARCLVLDWSPIQDPERLTHAQELAHNLPALGREWLTWLSENGAVVERVFKDFESTRTELYKDLVVFENAVNPGRLSSTITLLKLIWQVALQCPSLSEVLTEFNDDFEKGIEDLKKKAPADTIAANEAVAFVETLNELIGSGQAKLVQGDHSTGNERDIVGWIRSDGEICIFEKTARNLVSGIAQSTQNITNSSLHKQLEERGYIKTEVDSAGYLQRTLVRRFNGKTNRVLVFKDDTIHV